jgi:hypothetical protein
MAKWGFGGRRADREMADSKIGLVDCGLVVGQICVRNIDDFGCDSIRAEGGGILGRLMRKTFLLYENSITACHRYDR